MPLELPGLLLSGGLCAHTGCSFSCAIMHMSCRFPFCCCCCCWLGLFMPLLPLLLVVFLAMGEGGIRLCIALLLLLLALTCIDKRRCPGSSPHAVPCRRTAAMSCTHCDYSDAARSASAWAAAMMSRLDPPDRCPMRCGRYSMEQ